MMSGLLLALATVMALVGVALWPPAWADPRNASWWERARAVAGDPVPAAEVAVAAHLIAIALRAGLPVSTALEEVAVQSPGDIARDLSAVIGGYERRDDPALAWRAAPPVWQPVAAALTVAGRAGVAPGPLLLAAAVAILRRESSAQEAALGRVSIRLVLPLGLTLLPAFMCTTVIPLVLVMTRGYLAP